MQVAIIRFIEDSTLIGSLVRHGSCKANERRCARNNGGGNNETQRVESRICNIDNNRHRLADLFVTRLDDARADDDYDGAHGTHGHDTDRLDADAARLFRGFDCLERVTWVTRLGVSQPVQPFFERTSDE